MSKDQYLISKYHWKSRENFIELSADSAFSFLGIESKTKKGICGKFLEHVYWKSHFPNFKQKSSKAALVHMAAS